MMHGRREIIVVGVHQIGSIGCGLIKTRKFKLTKSIILQQIFSYLLGVDTFRGKKMMAKTIIHGNY